MKIVLISCTKKKQICACRAEEMYSVSNLFRKELAYAKTLTNPNNIYILSAKHGLLHLEDIIEPYNQTLNGQSINSIKLWSKMVFEQLEQKMDLCSIEIVFLAGKNYRKQLIPLLRKKYPNTSISVPTEGMGIGVQLKYYSERLRQL